MGFYYKILEKQDYRAGVELIRGAFELVVEDLGIKETSFASYGAYYTFQKMMSDVARGVNFVGAYDSTHKCLIGVVGYSRTKGNVGKIIKLSVALNYRHKGVGKRLLYEADYRCMNLACKRIEIGYIREHTVLAQWYRGLGYREGKTRPYKKTGLHITKASVELNHLESILGRYGYSHIRLNDLERDKVERVKRADSRALIKSQILLVYSSQECLRDSNTGYLVQQLLTEQVREFVWHRGADGLLQSYIKSHYGDLDELVLIYKTDKTKGHASEELIAYSEKLKSTVSLKLRGEKQVLILLDATWQEAKTIYKQSSFLQSLPMLTMTLDVESHFNLRRNQVEGGLCTVEIVLEVMKSQLPIELFQTYATIMEMHIRRAD